MLTELPWATRVWHIGDPHLGRRFENGVPLHRRGEREARQMEKFKAELATDCDVNIMVGDLFDHPQVSMQVILDAVDAVEDAAKARPRTQFFMMAGNHDRSRQLNTVGAWEIFRRMVEGRHDNLLVVDTVDKCETIAFVPWEWGKPVAQAIEGRFPEVDEEIVHVVLHHDLESFGGDDSYLVPTKLIKRLFPNVETIVTGHWHLEGDYKVDGIDVTCTGSLEPYSHAEDPNGEMYVTLTLEQFEERDPDELKDKCVRILLREGEELPTELDCAALTAKRIVDGDDSESVAERLGAFDWQSILDEHLKDVKPYVREFIDERMHANG